MTHSGLDLDELDSAPTRDNVNIRIVHCVAVPVPIFSCSQSKFVARVDFSYFDVLWPVIVSTDRVKIQFFKSLGSSGNRKNSISYELCLQMLFTLHHNPTCFVLDEHWKRLTEPGVVTDRHEENKLTDSLRLSNWFYFLNFVFHALENALLFHFELKYVVILEDLNIVIYYSFMQRSSV